MVFSTNIETSGSLTTALPNVSVSVGNTIVCGLRIVGCSLRLGNVTLPAPLRHRRAAGAATPLALLMRLFVRLFMRISF
jgi:hypothetical protein